MPPGVNISMTEGNAGFGVSVPFPALCGRGFAKDCSKGLSSAARSCPLSGTR